MQTTVAKWGNSQGLRIPREICNSLGIEAGTKADIDIDLTNSCLIVKFDKPKSRYSRNRKVSMAELTKDWNGEKAGEEWGGDDVGAEVVE